MAEPIVESSTEAVLNVAKTERIRVLHVDDDQAFLKVAEQCLGTQGEFEVDTASSVNEALEKLKETDYAVVVSDYQMPGKDGLEFLKELRKKGNTIPFIVFTGKGREEIAMKALNLGASGYFNKQGHPETVYGELAHGIRQAKERNETEMKMWEREERLRAVFHSSPDAITVSDLHGNILDCSEAAWKMFGFSSKEEMIGKSSFDFVAEKDREEALKNLKKTLEQGTTRNVEYTLLNKNGEKFWGELSASIVKDLLGNPVGFVGVIRDVSERKKAEQTLKESEEKYRSLVDLAPDGMVAVNAEGIVTSANRSFLTLVGYDSEEGIVGKPFTELKTMRMEDIPRFQGMFMSLMKGESPSPSEFLYVRRDGTSRWAEVHPGLLIKDGNPVGLQVIMRDVTERKKGEKTLQESEERFRTIFEGANDGILLADVKTKRFSLANPRICEITGYSLQELLKLGVDDIHPKKDLPHVIDSFTKLVQGKLTLAKDLPVLRKDEKVVCCDVSARSVKIGSQEYLVGLFRDVTERKKTEQTLRASLERYRSFIEVTGELGWTTNSEGEVVEDIPSFRKFTGQTYEEAKGWGWSKALHPDDLERATQIWEEATRTKSKYETEYRLRRHDGIYRHFMARSVPVLNEDGSIREWVGTCIDITDLKDVEEHLKEINMKLEVTNEKLHVVGSLTRHDVNNKLSAVTGNAYLLRQRLAEDPKTLEQLNDMEAAVRLVEKIFEFARIYEKLGTEQLVNMDVGEVVDGAVSLFSGLKGVKIVNECGGLTVLADSLLRQLFYNLTDNSLRYGEKIQQIRVYYKTSSSNQLELVYEDDGVGIPDNMRSNLFKEGFTSGKGTGYGLFMMRRICEVYGWTIQETGKQGKGVQFTMLIPRIGGAGKTNYQIQNPRQHQEKPETNMEVPNTLSPTEQTRSTAQFIKNYLLQNKKGYSYGMWKA